jgi:hypothetical protein
VAAAVDDGLSWLSEGALRLLSLGGLWARLDYRGLQGLQAAFEGHLGGRPWRYVGEPVLALPAVMIFLIAGTILLWIGRRIGSRAEPRFITRSRPRRRRRGSLS